MRKETAVLTCKSLNSLAPQYLTELFIKCSGGNGINLRSRETNLQIPLLRTSIGKSWNELSREAKLATSLKTFKKSFL